MSNGLYYSGRDVMAYTPLRNLAIRVVFKLADCLRFWRYPANIDVEDLRSFWRMAYWFYISERPVIRAEKGSGLETFFSQHRQAPAALLPSGFQGEVATTLSAVGDLMCNRALENSVNRYYESVADLIFNADISIGNLESSLTSGPIKATAFTADELPKINATPLQFDVIKGYQDRRYTVFQTANNHALDCGLEGLAATHERLEAEGFLYMGTNRNREDQDRGLIVDLNGVKFGFVAATWGVNNRPFPDAMEYLVNLVRFHRYDGVVDLSLVDRQMAWCRAQGCDVVIVCLHWGCEWEFYPRLHQVKLAHRLAEAGADVIIGQHAHVIQPMEWYRPQRDPDRWVPIVYNLGNLAALLTAPLSALSLVANMTFTKGRINGQVKTLVECLTLTPVIQIDQTVGAATSVWLEKLCDLWPATSRGVQCARIEDAAKYADLVLGPGWRHAARRQ